MIYKKDKKVKKEGKEIFDSKKKNSNDFFEPKKMVEKPNKALPLQQRQNEMKIPITLSERIYIELGNFTSNKYKFSSKFKTSSENEVVDLISKWKIRGKTNESNINYLEKELLRSSKNTEWKKLIILEKKIISLAEQNEILLKYITLNNDFTKRLKDENRYQDNKEKANLGIIISIISKPWLIEDNNSMSKIKDENENKEEETKGKDRNRKGIVKLKQKKTRKTRRKRRRSKNEEIEERRLRIHN
ncbi:hypothetical protein RhiirC2_782682 [Rhizophagus irregularis]|uniref:Uncharacterized protein n=1 Tax=Rhizophagus irregularis TaxID=588596 RepID=A0A2N1N2L9_9GLOM|nr:hypothetical protein RhiirC2_782682 [Rhizophagus irregularis]